MRTRLVNCGLLMSALMLIGCIDYRLDSKGRPFVIDQMNGWWGYQSGPNGAVREWHPPPIPKLKSYGQSSGSTRSSSRPTTTKPPASASTKPVAIDPMGPVSTPQQGAPTPKPSTPSPSNVITY